MVVAKATTEAEVTTEGEVTTEEDTTEEDTTEEDTMEEEAVEEVIAATAAATEVTVAAQGVAHMPAKLFRHSLATKSRYCIHHHHICNYVSLWVYINHAGVFVMV